MLQTDTATKNQNKSEYSGAESAYTAFDQSELYSRDFELDDERKFSVYQSYIGDVGCVVWDAAIVLGKFYEHIYQLKQDSYQSYSKDFPETSSLVFKISDKLKSCSNDRLLVELGSGTGVVGIVAAMFGANVMVTDLSEFVPLMKQNISRNSQLIAEAGGHCVAQELKWGTDPDPELSKADVILLADCIYYDESLEPLVKTLKDLSQTDTVIICCHEDRDTEHKQKLQKLFFGEVKKHFRVTQIPTCMQHPEYSSDDILIHVFELNS